MGHLTGGSHPDISLLVFQKWIKSSEQWNFADNSIYFNFPLLQFCSVFIFSLFMVNKWLPINDNNDWEFDFIDCYLVISVNKLMVYTDLFCVGWEKKETDSLVTYLFIYLFCLPILSSNQFRMSCQQEGELLLGIWTGQVFCFCVLTL